MDCAFAARLSRLVSEDLAEDKILFYRLGRVDKLTHAPNSTWALFSYLTGDANCNEVWCQWEPVLIDSPRNHVRGFTSSMRGRSSASGFLPFSFLGFVKHEKPSETLRKLKIPEKTKTWAVLNGSSSWMLCKTLETLETNGIKSLVAELLCSTTILDSM
jgi:hypothetical protein